MKYEQGKLLLPKELLFTFKEHLMERLPYASATTRHQSQKNVTTNLSTRCSLIYCKVKGEKKSK